MTYETLFSEIEHFKVNVSKYDKTKNHYVVRPSSLKFPRSHAVMFILNKYMPMADCFNTVESCLIFWPAGIEIPQSIRERHAVCETDNPHLAYCQFFKENGITNYIQNNGLIDKGGYYVSENVSIGKNPTIFPFVILNGNITIGDNVYIGAGTKIIGNVYIGNNVVIKENSVLGADGLSTDRDIEGKAVTMPQFGGLVIQDNVIIGANTTVARGAIDNTIICSGCKIDNSVYISHNAYLGENVFMCGESHTFGSVTIGKNTQVSGNAAIRNGVTVGNGCLIGAGAMVTRNVKDNTIVSGNPAREMLFPK